MRRIRRSLLLVGLMGMLLFTAGMAWASCDGNYATWWDNSDCVMLDQTMTDSCCRPAGAGTRRCATCWRDDYLCAEGSDLVEKAGAAYNCGAPGAICH